MAQKKILVVDDSPTELRLVVSALQGKGFELITATDGEEALDKALREMPELIVLDIVLPKKNGFQVCRQLKTAPDTQNIKVLLLSSKSQDSDRYWGLKQGADGYVTKPFNDADLLQTVGSML
jgi:twitching motility two-component system response regulator PilH